MSAPATQQLLLLAALTTPLFAQGLALRDDSRSLTNMVAFDSARQRLVELGRHGETREFDGSRFLRRPGAGPRLIGHMEYRSTVDRTIAFGHGYDVAAATFLPATWEYDGVAWQQIATAADPGVRSTFASTYDSVRDRVIVFGGTAGGVLGDTWEWSGSSWAQVATAGPAPRVASAMAFDAARGVAVLFGGQVLSAGIQGDHWEWNGSTWTQRILAVAPSARRHAAMTYDVQRGVVVLHGGFDGAGYSAELWEFDGVAWLQAAFVGGPGPLIGHDLVYDDSAGATLLRAGEAAGQPRDYWQWDGATWQLRAAVPLVPKGGRGTSAAADPLQGGLLLTGGMFNSDTWRYANGSWTQLPMSAPTSRVDSVMWSDGAGTWLFGGGTALTGSLAGDTLQWSGTAWQQLAVGVGPSARTNSAVAFDSLRGHAVLFGGHAGSYQSDTWTFDGSAWQQRFPVTVPPPRENHGMAYDPLRDRVVVFGGRGGFPLVARNDTWEWDGTDWSLVNVAQPPPAFGAAAMEYDARTDLIVMTHALDSQSLTPTPVQVWTYDGAAWTQVALADERVAAPWHDLVRIAGTDRILLVESEATLEFELQVAQVAPLGVACGAAPPSIAARDLPVPGNADFGIDVVGAAPSSVAVLGGANASASVPFGSCTLHLPPSSTAVFVPTNAAGFGSRDLAMPPQPTLLGTTWYFQALVVQPATPGGFALSAALEVEVGN